MELSSLPSNPVSVYITMILIIVTKTTIINIFYIRDRGIQLKPSGLIHNVMHGVIGQKERVLPWFIALCGAIKVVFI